MRATPLLRRLGAVAVLGLALTACSGSGADSSGGGGSSDSGEVADLTAGGGSADMAATADGGATATDGPAANAAVAAAAQGRSVISTARVSVEVDDVPAALRAAETLVLGTGGLVSASSSTGGSAAPPAEDPDANPADDSVATTGGTATMTLRVPADRFETVLQQLADLGTQLERTTTSTDVSAEVADVDSRVASAQAVLATLRDRLPEARTIADVLTVENELANREAELEALQARQRVLADQVALSTIDVAFSTATPATAVSASDGGFLDGLANGWRALGRTVHVAGTVLGTTLPFLVPLAAVAGAWWVLRRRRQPRAQG